jgi:hypothetical protein
MNRTDWARLHKAGVPIETIAQVVGMSQTDIEAGLEKQAKQRAKIRTLHEVQEAPKPAKRKAKRPKNPKKPCEHCKTVFGRKRRPSGVLEDRTDFATRRFCSQACSRQNAQQKAAEKKAAKQQKAAEEAALPETKICRQCQVEFPWPIHKRSRRRIHRKDWASRLYCSNACKFTRQSQLFAAARAPIAPQPAVPEVALFRILPQIVPAPETDSDAEWLIRLCGGEP